MERWEWSGALRASRTALGGFCQVSAAGIDKSGQEEEKRSFCCWFHRVRQMVGNGGRKVKLAALGVLTWGVGVALFLRVALPSWRGSQVVRQRSAKPLFVGSIPTRASN